MRPRGKDARTAHRLAFLPRRGRGAIHGGRSAHEAREGKPGRGFTIKEAAAVVEEHLGGARLVSMRPLPGGLRNANYRLATSVGPCALRVFAREDRLKQAEEEIALRHLARASDPVTLPVPRVLGAGLWRDTCQPYLLLSMLPGAPPGRGLPWLGQVERLRFSRQLGRLMAMLHDVPPPVPGFGTWVAADPPPGAEPAGASWRLADPRDRPGILSYEREGFTRVVRRCLREGWLSDEAASAARRFVERRMAFFREDEPAVFVHHDLHADNTLLEGEGGSLAITGLLDFEHARGRAAEYDWVMALWSLPEDGTSADYSRVGPLRRAFMEGYAEVRPAHPEWRERLLAYEMIKAVGFLVYKPAYADFLERNRDHVFRLLDMDRHGGLP